MNILVTGGAGFIGSHLVETLVSDGHKVTVIDNLCTGRLENLSNIKDKINLLNLDISKNDDLSKYFEKIDKVFHLAGLADIIPSIKNPGDYYRTNVNGTFNVLEASRKANVKKLIYSASASCYGLPEVCPTPESSEIKPMYPYALTKWLGEELVMSWKKIYSLPTISLRFFNVYGPRSRSSGTYGAVFGVFLAQKIAGKPFTIVGDGKQTRDFTYVSDVVDAMIKASESNVEGEIFNIGSEKDVSVNRIAELLEGEKVYIPKRPGEPEKSLADISKIKKTLSWEPKISLEKGIKIMLENIDFWKSAPVWTPSSINDITSDWFKFLEDK